MAHSISQLPVNTTFRENASGIPIIPKKQEQAAVAGSFFGSDGASFKDVLDTVNPLQQLPGVGMLYRAGTGDTISPAAKIAGGALFGGPIGAIIGAVDAIVEMASGASVSDHVIAAATAPASPATPPVSEDVAQALADVTLSEQAKRAAEEQAKKDAEEQAVTDFLSIRQPETVVDAKEAEKAAENTAGIALDSARTTSQFVYARQERVYANEQALEGMYREAVTL
jgi:microcompartment protein CcmL/EutN